jgi:hypothetical protein
MLLDFANRQLSAFKTRLTSKFRRNVIRVRYDLCAGRFSPISPVPQAKPSGDLLRLAALFS